MTERRFVIPLGYWPKGSGIGSYRGLAQCSDEQSRFLLSRRWPTAKAARRYALMFAARYNRMFGGKP